MIEFKITVKMVPKLHCYTASSGATWFETSCQIKKQSSTDNSPIQTLELCYGSGSCNHDQSPINQWLVGGVIPSGTFGTGCPDDLVSFELRLTKRSQEMATNILIFLQNYINGKNNFLWLSKVRLLRLLAMMHKALFCTAYRILIFDLDENPCLSTVGYH